MIKKFTGLFFCIAMLFSMSGCGGSKVDDSALDALQSAIANMADMKSADYNVMLSAKDASDDASFTLHGSFNVATAKPQFSAILDVKSNGKVQNNYMAAYLQDGNIYLNMMDIAKQKASLSDVLKGQSMPSISIDKDTVKIPKEKLKGYLKEASIKDDTITLVCNTDKIRSLIEKDIKKNLTKTPVGNPIASLDGVSFDKVQTVIKLKNKMITSAVINIEASKKDDKKDTAVMVLSFNFNNINKVNKIDFPDFSDYAENPAIPSV